MHVGAKVEEYLATRATKTDLDPKKAQSQFVPRRLDKAAALAAPVSAISVPAKETWETS